MGRIGFVTCEASKLGYFYPTATEPDFIPTEPPFTPDDQLAVNALRAKGHTVAPLVWGTPVTEAKGFDLVVVRSPWDYADTPDNCTRFMAWLNALAEAGVRVANDPALMHWLLDKHYLQAVETLGIPIVPTHYVEPGEGLDLADLLVKRGPFIIKPTVSAAGYGLHFIQTEADAQDHQPEVNETSANRKSYMVQEFMPQITTHGEWSLVFLGGAFSHALHKKPASGSILVHAERGGSVAFVAPPPGMIECGRRAYDAITPAFRQASGKTLGMPILYLRLDFIETPAGPVLSECEGVEPELFFRARPDSTDAFCRAIEGLFSPLGALSSAN